MSKILKSIDESKLENCWTHLQKGVQKKDTNSIKNFKNICMYIGTWNFRFSKSSFLQVR